MEKIRVLAVDDSAVIRRLLREVLSSDDQFDLVGVAANGRVALAMIDQCAPDAVTLDIEMPEMDGLQTLSAIRARNWRLPVVMFSTLTERGAEATIEALSRGASDYVTKPADASGFAAAAEQIRKQLLPKLKTLCGAHRSVVKPAASLSTFSGKLRASLVAAPVDVVAIGSSTGGPNALAEVLRVIPPDFPAPIVIVQHMPPLFTRFLAERLSKSCQICVREAASGDSLTAGQALIAPGDYHIRVVRQGGCARLATDQGPPENSCRPSVDVLFRSVSEAYGSRALAVVMTGMGQDGLLGAQSIHQRGGRVLVQDEATSVVWGMPGFVAKAGLAHQIVPLHAIGAEIVRTASRNRPVRPVGQTTWA